MKQKSIFTYFWECFTVNFCNFRGRARRKEYWSFVLVNTLINMGANIVFQFIPIDYGSIPNYESMDVAEVLGGLGVYALVVLYNLVALVPGVAVSVRRLHDLGWSGWWLLLYYALLVVSVVYVFSRVLSGETHILAATFILCVLFSVLNLVYWVIMLLPGKPGVNKWGLNPKEADMQEQWQQYTQY